MNTERGGRHLPFAVFQTTDDVLQVLGENVEASNRREIRYLHVVLVKASAGCNSRNLIPLRPDVSAK